MTPEQYKELSYKEKIFADLLVEIIRQNKRIADMMDMEVKGAVIEH